MIKLNFDMKIKSQFNYFDNSEAVNTNIFLSLNGAAEQF